MRSPPQVPIDRMSHKILIITALKSAPEFAAALEHPLSASVDVEANRKSGVVALRRHSYDVVVVDAALVEGDPEGADLIWKQADLAVPLEFNFAIGSGVRLVREVQAALNRRSREQSLALRSAASVLETELRSTVTGLLLQSQLALEIPDTPPTLTGRIRTIVELTGSLRRQLDQALAH